MIKHLGRYEILEELGRGSMGIVYKAVDPLIERHVAIKAINLQNIDPKRRAEYEARFNQEAKAAGCLNHSNIVTIYDLGESGDVAYIAMELLEGCELHNDVDEMPRMPLAKALDIAIQVADGLTYAHQHGIVHRDIKPSNIMVLKDSHVKIADFGIAKMDSSLMLTRTGMIMGSPLYMSPEQILSSGIDSRSDIFSFGIVLYQLLTGHRPFAGDNANSVMFQIVNEHPRKPSSLNPHVPEMMDDIVSKCLAKKPQDRYTNTKDLADDLRACRDKLLGAKHGLDHLNLFSLDFTRLKRLAVPGAISQRLVIAITFVSIGLIFFFDVITDATIQLHMLYIFPLVLIGFHCSKKSLVYLAVILSLFLQGLSLVFDPTLPLFSQTVLGVLVFFSNILIAYVSGVARVNFLEVGRLASFDGLTGLRNRLTFESLTDMEISRQRRNGGVFSFAFIDVDNLKELNDVRGFQAGDDALKLLANILKDHIRETDIAARLGGDEFAILMPNTEAAGCEQFCKDLSVKISTLMRKADIPVSTSIGYVTVDHPPGSISEVFNRAESAMHLAQTKGHGGFNKG